ncbi:hypothetical protein LLH06_14205 [Mucilaginibacter daejeonensis]|uniref:hypothetical protein n=1 Tax=Mucilaginibacter daejeonensis TaxID=398049 RepID=UPI001D17BC77|nr:hypothetical protein [Mucilaginibacter daejeonensis]UEG52115.1 hypothetical protein LLH06_14205 [Mucilaginibacter daejeonensis]
MSRIITLCYRKLIDVSSTAPWDRMVFEDSYMEFKIQAQNYTLGTSYTYYADIIRHIPQASQLVARVTPSVTGYIQQLDQVIPDLVNNIGKRFLTFSNFEFEIINSSLVRREDHRIAISFYSGELLWLDTIGDMLLLAKPTNGPAEEINIEVQTFLFKIPPYVNIHSIRG